MITVDIKPLLGRLNRFCTRSMTSAAGLCVSRSHYEVSVEHLLYQMIEEESGDTQKIMKHFNIDLGQIRKILQQGLDAYRSGNSGKPVFSPVLLGWFQEAWLTASIDLSLSEIRSGALWIALASDPHRYVADIAEPLSALRLDELKKRFFEITDGSSEAPKLKEGETKSVRGDDSALARFTVDFTARAKAGEIDPVFGRDREIRQMIDILSRRRKNNPIVVGEAGVGKTAVVEGLALKVVQNDIPDLLKGVQILGLDMGLLQAGASVKGEFENRLKGVISEVKSSPTPIILFIDEAHTLVGAGGAAGVGDAANLIKPALARGEMRTIAATTWSEYKKYFEKDAALARRFQAVALDEPTEEGAVVILRGLRDQYETAHQVLITDEAVVAAAKMSNRYISGRQLPDKAVDLLDTAAARVKVALVSKPGVIEDAERRIQAMERERSALMRDIDNGLLTESKRLVDLEKEIADQQVTLTATRDRWVQEKKDAEQLLAIRAEMMKAELPADKARLRNDLIAAREALKAKQGKDPLLKVEVDPEVVAQVISDWTGVPVGKMVQDEAKTVLNLNARLEGRIKGQDEAIEAIARGIRASKAGVGNPEAPIGVFLLVGPSGVGKTEMALAITDLLFGGERFMTTVNMSEFQEKHTVSRLIGSPPGYVGYGEGGVLTEAVRQKPYSLVLLDEVEKADKDVMNLFYQVFDKGMLSDGEGRVINFKNTVLFLTSNLASDIITKLCTEEERPDAKSLIEQIRPTLSQHFKPALLARMTIVPFYALGVDAIATIADLKLKRIGKRLMESHRMSFEYNPEVVALIAKRCTEVETGARNIDHIMQETLLPQIATEILGRMGEGPLPEKLTLGLTEDEQFSYTFS